MSVDDTEATILQRPRLISSHKACLVYIYPKGPRMGKRYALSNEPLLIGRGSDCAITLDDTAASRHHLRLEPTPEGLLAIDLESTNGTYINDEQINRQILEDGDYLRVGRTLFRFLAGGNVEAEYHEEIYRLTILDSLTGISNTRHLIEFLDRELSRSQRHHRPLALVLLDIDHFKNINDTLGHLAGDQTLRDLVDCLLPCVRRDELLARYGGEEFILVLPETDLQGGIVVADRMRKTVEQTRFSYEGNIYPVTISCGVAAITGEEGLASKDFIKLADEKLYAAKDNGRNRVEA